MFATGGLLLTRMAADFYRDRAGEFMANMDLVRHLLRPIGTTENAARILQWPRWPTWEDSVVVTGPIGRRSDGSYSAQGVVLNPLGAAPRGAAFDMDAVLGAIYEAMDKKQPVTGARGGRAVPVEGYDPGLERETVWGGLWYQDPGPPGVAAVFGRLLPWFLISTLLLTGANFYLLRKLVLEPVEALARAARRVRGGDLAARAPESSRSDELAQLVRSFNAMTSEVQGFNERLAEEVRRATEKARRAESAAMTQRRLAAMGELAAGIAHEINNPLGGLVNAAEALARPDLKPERRERYVALLIDGLDRIRVTVGKLLRFSPRESEPVPVHLGHVALDALDLVRHRAQREGVRLVLSANGRELAPGPPAPPELGRLPAIEGAPNELGQAVLNLLVNALDAHAQGGAAEPAGAPRVEVSVAETTGEDGEPELVLAVEDNGPGVSGDELERVSDLFYTTKQVGQGTGLGLAVVHNVVASHRGRVLLSSRPGQGFRVELRFPPGRWGEPPAEEARGA